MLQIISLRDFKKSEPMEQVMIRLPGFIREQARTLASKQTERGKKATETDVYRTAILLFLSGSSTNSRNLHENSADSQLTEAEKK